MARASATEWAERVRAWRSSGLTSKEFCRGRGFTAQTLLWWSCQLSRKKNRGPKTGKGQVALARVVSSAATAGTRAAIRIEVGGARLDVAAGADRDTLSMVLDALRAAPTGAKP